MGCERYFDPIIDISPFRMVSEWLTDRRDGIYKLNSFEKTPKYIYSFESIIFENPSLRNIS
jgi:hypothetical protein